MTPPTPASVAAAKKIIKRFCGLGPLCHIAWHGIVEQDIIDALDATEVATRWSRDREWDALILKVLCGMDAESADPSPSEEKVKTLRAELEAATWEAAGPYLQHRALCAGECTCGLERARAVARREGRTG